MVQRRQLCCFNAARGFVCGARSQLVQECTFFTGFNAARGFVCGARKGYQRWYFPSGCFNAARGFVCGARAGFVKVGKKYSGFNAARGFVCGARQFHDKDVIGITSFNAARGFVCGARFILHRKIILLPSFNAARGFVCGASLEVLNDHDRYWRFQCRSRLCLWCKYFPSHPTAYTTKVSMPLAALFVVQAQVWQPVRPRHRVVSMPLAALFVVQVVMTLGMVKKTTSFNAARGFVCGASPSLAALVSLVSNGSFGKSPDV